MTLRDRIRDKVQRGVTWLDEKGIGTPVRWGCILATVVVPVLLSFEDFQTLWLLVLVAIAALVLLPLQHFHEGSVAHHLTVQFGSVTGSFAGALEDLAHLVKGKGRRLDDREVKTLCIGLLHRIRDIAAIAMGDGNNPGLRATLAVPLLGEDGEPVALKVWCYDQTHTVRKYTRIELYHEGEPRPGAPAAFLAGVDGFSIIYDLRTVAGTESGRNRPYLSVASFSVPMLGSNGKPLAVVNLDAPKAGAFDDRVVGERIRPHIGPMLAAIGLVLTLRRKEGGYDFPR